MMKSARPESERAPRATNPTSRPRRSPSTTSDFQSGMTKLGHILVKILTFPVQILHWLTHPPGSSIMLGLAVLYFALLNTEGYWQAMPGMHPSFLPKPFVDDAADLQPFPSLPSTVATLGKPVIQEPKMDEADSHIYDFV